MFIFTQIFSCKLEISANKLKLVDYLTCLKINTFFFYFTELMHAHWDYTKKIFVQSF